MVRAPFTLHTVGVDTRTGQAAGERWYLAPYRLWKRRMLWPSHRPFKLSFDYALGEGQYLGSMSFFAGRGTWRQI